MKKCFYSLVLFASMIAVLASCQQKPSKEKLIGTWTHPIKIGQVEINTDNGNNFQDLYNNEIFKFYGDGTFVMGEYSGSKPLYEVNGRWDLSDDKKYLLFTYEDGSTSQIDIRGFDGNSFVTTSIQGNDFLYTKE